MVLNRATRPGHGLACVGDWITKKGFCFSWVFFQGLIFFFIYAIINLNESGFLGFKNGRVKLK